MRQGTQIPAAEGQPPPIHLNAAKILPFHRCKGNVCGQAQDNWNKCPRCEDNRAHTVFGAHCKQKF